MKSSAWHSALRAAMLSWLAVLLLAWGVTSVAGSAMWWVELLRFTPYPVWLVPTVLLGLAALRLERRWWMIALGMLAIVALGLTEPVVGRAESGTVPLRVMTYNVKAYKTDIEAGGIGRIVWEVMQHDPDVLLMQDADFGSAPGETLPAPWRAFVQGREVVTQGEYVIVSRLPLRGCDQGDLSFARKRRQFLRCVIDVKGRLVEVVNVHLQSPRAGLAAVKELQTGAGGSWRENLEGRLQQARRLADQLAGLPRPVIVGGDFNAVGSSPVLQPLRDIGYRDAFETAGKGWGYTHGHSLRLGLDFWRLDHILVSSGIRVWASHTGGAGASEHRPVIADLRLQPH